MSPNERKLLDKIFQDKDLKEIIDATENQIVHLLANKNNRPIQEARKIFSSSNTCASLKTEATGLWKESTAYIMYLFENE